MTSKLISQSLITFYHNTPFSGVQTSRTLPYARVHVCTQYLNMLSWSSHLHQLATDASYCATSSFNICARSSGVFSAAHCNILIVQVISMANYSSCSYSTQYVIFRYARCCKAHVKMFPTFVTRTRETTYGEQVLVQPERDVKTDWTALVPPSIVLHKLVTVWVGPPQTHQQTS